MSPERSYRVRLMLENLDVLHNLEVDHECMPMRRREDGLIEMEAIVTESSLTKLRRMRKRKVVVEVLADRTVEAADAMKLVSPTNRYADGSLPSGPGTRRG